MFKTILNGIFCLILFVGVFICVSLLIKSDTKSVNEETENNPKKNKLEYDNDEYDYGHNVNVRKASEDE